MGKWVCKVVSAKVLVVPSCKPGDRWTGLVIELTNVRVLDNPHRRLLFRSGELLILQQGTLVDISTLGFDVVRDKKLRTPLCDLSQPTLVPFQFPGP